MAVAVVSVEAALQCQIDRSDRSYNKVCALSCSSSKSNIVPVTGSLALTTNERMSCFSCFRSICLVTKSAVYYFQQELFCKQTSNTFVRPSRTNRGSGMIFRTGINHGIPSNYCERLGYMDSTRLTSLTAFPTASNRYRCSSFSRVWKLSPNDRSPPTYTLVQTPERTYVKRETSKPLRKINRSIFRLCRQYLA
jgi:hypothetical protein